MTSSDQPVLTLAIHALSIAQNDFMNLCVAGISENAKARYDFDEHAYQSSQRALSSPHTSPFHLPTSLTNRSGFLDAGLFQSLTLKNILKLCFTQEAVEYLVKNGYNDYIFWSNLYAFGGWMVNTPVEQQSMPFGLDLVKQQIALRRTPFGLTDSPYRTFNRKLIKAAIVANGGQFDPDKLEPGYAMDLLDVGLLLCIKRRNYNDISELIVNPMWQHMVDEIAADDTIGAVTVPGAPTSTDAPVPVRGKLYGFGKITGSLEIELSDSHTAQEVADLLSSGRAHVEGASVLLPHAPPAEGSMVIATVTNPRPSFLNYSAVSWSSELPALEAVTTALAAAAPDCTSKKVKLSALGQISGEVEVETIGNTTLTEIAELLTSHRARISDGSVVVPHAPPAEGMTVIAKVIGQARLPAPVGSVVWSVIG